MDTARRWARVRFLAFGFAIFLSLAGCTRGPRAGSLSAAGSKGGAVDAPEFLLESISGAKVGLSSLRGRPVLVHFWASWCPPCLPELPHVIAFAAKMRVKGWTVLAVSTDADWQKVKAALPVGEALPANFVVLLDPSSRVAEAYGSYMYPETYWLNGEGRVERKWVGPQDWETIAQQL